MNDRETSLSTSFFMASDNQDHSKSILGRGALSHMTPNDRSALTLFGAKSDQTACMDRINEASSVINIDQER